MDANQCACDTLGYTQEELRTLAVMDIDINFNQEEFQKHRTQVKEHHPKVIETTQRRKDGTLFPVEIVVNYHEFEGEKIYISFQKDMTALKEAEIGKEKTEKKLCRP